MSKKRYTKSEREQAALICAIAASNPRLKNNYTQVCEALDLDQDCVAHELAIDAAIEVTIDVGIRCWPENAPALCELDAETEALIRTGWSS